MLVRRCCSSTKCTCSTWSASRSSTARSSRTSRRCSSWPPTAASPSTPPLAHAFSRLHASCPLPLRVRRASLYATFMATVESRTCTRPSSLNRIRGTNYMAPHGMPLDLLDRLLIVSAEPYTMEEINLILKTRYSHFLGTEHMHQELIRSASLRNTYTCTSILCKYVPIYSA